jgi:YD repeat-containing protein
MKNLPVFLMTSVGLFLFSCSKNNNSTNSNNSTLVKSYTDVLNSLGNSEVITFNLTYDGQNRLVSMKSNPPATFNYEYTYPSNNTATLDYYDNGQISEHQMLWLNSNSYLDSVYRFDDSGDTTTEKYLYNGINLVQYIQYNYSTTATTVNNITNYTYDNQGNLVSTLDSYGKSVAFTYYTDSVNNFNFGNTFLPLPQFYVKTEILTVGTTTTLAESHYYTFDDKNRLIKDSASIYTNGNNGSDVKTYTY